MPHWFFTQDGKDYGPYSSNKVADMVLKDKLELESYIISDKDKIWVKVRDVPEIMDIIHEPVAEPIFDEGAANQFASFINTGVEIKDYFPIGYNMPAKRLVWLNILTLGFFQIYWFYKQWRYQIAHRLNKYESRSMMAVKYLFLFAYEIFYQIENNPELMKVKRSKWSSWKLALLWYLGPGIIIFSPFPTSSIAAGMLSTIVEIMISTYVLSQVQSYINEINAELKRPVSRPSFGCYFTILLAGVIITFIIVTLLRFFHVFAA
ncbi:MAG: GYF domain-containing protein [Candidatus Cloacimonetes bacterium]|nr:GYF domain-containing protein [Candidatus Cloacimonadota bacterium]